jgi:hypothetical protein
VHLQRSPTIDTSHDYRFPSRDDCASRRTRPAEHRRARGTVWLQRMLNHAMRKRYASSRNARSYSNCCGTSEFCLDMQHANTVETRKCVKIAMPWQTLICKDSNVVQGLCCARVATRCSITFTVVKSVLVGYLNHSNREHHQAEKRLEKKNMCTRVNLKVEEMGSVAQNRTCRKSNRKKARSKTTEVCCNLSSPPSSR